MLEDALLDLTDRGDIVVDPFLGSGSTLIAADKTGRVCRGVELDPLYVDVIVRRYEAATGEPAVLVETGETFEALAARRALEQELVSYVRGQGLGTQSSDRSARKPSAGIGRSCAELGAERETTVDQALIRGLVTAFRVYVSGLSSV
jgi:hypothetical protein